MKNRKFSFAKIDASDLSFASTDKESAFTKFSEEFLAAKKVKDLKNLFSTDLARLELSIPQAAPKANVEVPALSGPNNLVIINGSIDKKRSGLKDLTALERPTTKGPEFLQLNYWSYLNEAFNQSEIVVRPQTEAKKIDLNIHYYFTGCKGELTGYFPRLVFDVPKDISLSINEYFAPTEAFQFFCGATYTFNLNEGSHLRHFLKQDLANDVFHLGQYKVYQKENSHFESFASQQGSQNSFLQLEIEQLAIKAKCELFGISVATKNQKLSQLINCIHKAEEGQSSQFFKAIVDDEATNSFKGMIVIDKTAAKTHATQLSKNLLLSNSAQALAVPGLKIDTDDVKCYHGATVSDLREDELFYLLSRGIDGHNARKLLAKAFIFDVALSIADDELREKAKEHVNQVFARRPILK